MARIEDRLQSLGLPLPLPLPTQPPPGVVLPLRFVHGIGSRALAACVACAALGACSMQQLYATGQQWQRTLNRPHLRQ